MSEKLIKCCIQSISDAIDSLYDDMRDYHRHINDEPILRTEDIKFSLNIAKEVRDKLLSNEETKKKFSIVANDYISEIEEIIKYEHTHDSSGFPSIYLHECKSFLNSMQSLIEFLETELKNDR